MKRQSQKERRKNPSITVQSGYRQTLHRPPPLHPSTSVFLSHCISRRHRHDCSISCEHSRSGYSITTYFYTCLGSGLPVECWTKTIYNDVPRRPDEYRRIWKNPSHNPRERNFATYGSITEPTRPHLGYFQTLFGDTFSEKEDICPVGLNQPTQYLEPVGGPRSEDPDTSGPN